MAMCDTLAVLLTLQRGRLYLDEMGKQSMVKVVIFCLRVALLLVVFQSTAVAQVAVEYGIVGSKPPPKAADTGKTISKKVEAGFKKSPSSDQGYKRQTKGQSRPAGKAGGPLIIEKRGDHYERVN
jgi:hypothetical protein